MVRKKPIEVFSMKNDIFACADPIGTHRMAYTEWGSPSERPSVICVHGLTRNGRDFDRLAEALEKSGRHVICPDIVGRGKSDFLTDHPELYTYPQYVADLNGFLAAKNLKAVHWVGTSMGGIIGMLMAAMPETPIRRLALNDVGPFIPLAALQRIAAYVGMPLEFADKAQLVRYIRQIYEPFGITREKDWQNLVEHSQRTLPNGKLTLAHDPAIAKVFGEIDKDVDLWAVYDAIQCPVLLLRGEKSDILSAEVAEAMTQRGPKAKLITYAGIGHAPALMDEIQIGDVCGFLESCDAQSPKAAHTNGSVAPTGHALR
jgi:pimeloyl-ACP methyl ester carboxylesterase